MSTLVVSELQHESASSANITLDSSGNTTINGTLSGDGSSLTGITANDVVAVRRSSNQSLTKNTITKVQFDTEDSDSNGWFDNSTNYRFQPDESGNYLVLCCLNFSGQSSEDRYTGYVYKNGSESYSSETDVISPGSNSGHLSFSAVLSMNGSSDYLEIYTRSGHNGSPAIDATVYNGSTATGSRALFVRLS